MSLKEATINGLAKIDYTDGTANLLVEPARTNLVTYSEDFGNAFWNFNTEISKDLNSIAAPDSTSTADKIKGTTASSRHYIARSALANASESASFSVFAKAGELRYLQIASFNTVNQHANFDLLTGTIGNIGSDFANVKIKPLTNGWYRITLTSVGKYNGFYLFLVSGLTAGWAETWSMSNDTDGLYLWGAQAEEQSQATAYIKSDGIAAVRKATTTNLLTYSEDITSSTGYIPSSGVTISSNQGTSPIGDNNATKLTSTGTDPFIQNQISSTKQTFTLSIYAKGVGSSIGKNINFFLIRDNYAEAQQSSAFVLTNDWVRYESTLTLTGTPSANVTFRLDAPSVAVVGDEVLIWGAQLEEQTQAETYAKTTGLPVTIDLFTENNYGTMTNMSASDIIEDTPNN